MVNDITVAESDSSVTASLVIRTVWDRPQVASPRFGMAAPRLIHDLLDRFEVQDAGHRLTKDPSRLDAANATVFVDDLLLNRDRTRPVVLISDDPRTMRPLVDPDALGRELAGLAHVFYTLYGQPAAVASRALGEFGCRNGAMRIWWPGLDLNSDPYRHRLYSASTLRNWQGTPSPVQQLFRAVSVAAATNAAPAVHAEIRRSARRAQLAAATDVADLTAIAEGALQDQDNLREQLRTAQDSNELMALEREEHLQQIQQLEDDKRSMAEAWAQQGIERDAAEMADEDQPTGDPPTTVLEAVNQAIDLCPHLSFADRAFESAEESPYEFPEDILEDLLKLERAAALWARPEGIGGMDLGQKATELGLHWKAGVSMTATGGNRGRGYEFTWRAERLQMGPHTRRDRGNGAGRIARIYLAKHEPENPSERLLIVAHVGKKLDDSTTG